MRIGHGYDSHRFEDGRKLFLGGVEFPGETGLKGHSDADVLIHAIIDALLGAAAMGDIGELFPDTDPRFKGADSRELLKEVVRRLDAEGWSIGNVDATVVCERPRLRPRMDEIRATLSSIMGIGVSQVSVKGKTNEKMDDVGASLGIVAYAVALIERKDA